MIKLFQYILKVRFGLKDEKIQALHDKYVEAGTDTRDKCYGDWNVSTQGALPREHYRKIQAEYLFYCVN